MAHRNRWFTVLKNGWIFHGYGTNNQMVICFMISWLVITRKMLVEPLSTMSQTMSFCASSFARTLSTIKFNMHRKQHQENQMLRSLRTISRFSSIIMFFLVNILEANKDDLPCKMKVLMGTKIICTPGFAEDSLGNLWGICLLCKFT